MKRARRAAGLTVEFMAEHFNMSVPAIRSWEQSLHKPNKLWDVLPEWARLTNVSYTWLLTGSGPIVTKSLTEYDSCHLQLVDERQMRLPLDPSPPAEGTAPALALIQGAGAEDGAD